MEETKEILKMLGEVITLLSNVVSILDKLVSPYTTSITYTYPPSDGNVEITEDYLTSPPLPFYKEPETTFGE